MNAKIPFVVTSASAATGPLRCYTAGVGVFFLPRGGVCVNAPPVALIARLIPTCSHLSWSTVLLPAEWAHPFPLTHARGLLVCPSPQVIHHFGLRPFLPPPPSPHTSSTPTSLSSTTAKAPLPLRLVWVQSMVLVSTRHHPTQRFIVNCVICTIWGDLGVLTEKGWGEVRRRRWT